MLLTCVVFLFFCLLSPEVTLAQFFTTKPPETVYGVLRSSVFLDWGYSKFTQVKLRRWTLRRLNEAEEIFLMSIQPRANNTLFVNTNQLYKGRLSYNSQGGLTINNLTLQDEGTIMLTVTDENLTLNQGATELKIFYPLEVTLPSPGTTYVEYEKITLTCTVKSYPKATVIWFKGNTAVFNDSVYNILETLSTDNGIPMLESRLVLENSTRHQAGIYYCDASHFSGQVKRERANVTVNIFHPPVIFNFPTEEVGEISGAKNVKLECAVKSNPLSNITWYIKGNAFQPPNTRYELATTTEEDPLTKEQYRKSILTIKEITTDDFGTYKCEAINIVNGQEQKTEKSLELVISHKPYYLAKPDPIVIVETAGNVTLNCTVQGYPAPTVWWSTNSSLPSTRYVNKTSRIDNTGKTVVYALLELKDLRAEDFGLFTCYAVESKTVETSHTILKISYPPKLSGLDKQVHVEEDQISFIECIVDSFPESSIKWFFSKDNLNYLENTTSSTNEVLTSPSYANFVGSKFHFQKGKTGKVHRDDQGFYYCEATNTDGVRELRTEVIVDWKPTIQSFIGPRDVKLYERATFTCIIESKHKPTVTWLRDSLPVPPEYDQRISKLGAFYETFLTIQNVSVADKATFTCRAEDMVVDSLKSAEKTRSMNVKYKPIPSINSTVQEVGLDTETIILSCTADANPPITEYRWSKDGELQEGKFNQSTYTIATSSRESEGMYTCTPRNSEGDGPLIKHEVIVRSEPVFTKLPACTVVDETINCVCEGTGYSVPAVHWTKNGSDIIEAQGSNLTLIVGGNASEAYICHLTNSDGKNSIVLQLQDFIPELTPWSSWIECNITCGSGYTSRNRSRNFISDNLKKTHEVVSCKGTGCPTVSEQASDWHKDWYIAFWVAIPVLAILLIVCFLYVRRRNERTEKAILVPQTRVISTPSTFGTVNSANNLPNGHSPFSETRRMSATRDIYLPSNVPMTALNKAYIPENEEPEVLPSKYETDTIEVEMKFNEDENLGNDDTTNTIPDYPEKVDGIEEEEDNFSFPGSTFNHLNPSTNNKSSESFVSLHDSNSGPPKPPRRNNSSFVGGPSGFSNAIFTDDDEGEDVPI